MKALKVIILYNRLFHYRIPVWNLLAEKCDLTVTYSLGDGKIPDGLECKFKVLYLPGKLYFSRFFIQDSNIRSIVKNYDVVIAYGDPSWLKFSTLVFGKTKIVFHTLGVSASYEKKFDEHKKWDWVNKFFYKRANALAFYTDYPISKYEAMGISREKMFEAPNTVAVLPLNVGIVKDSLLFIGTLYRQKGIGFLLESYKQLKCKCNLPILNIIGRGPDYEFYKKWIAQNGLEDLVKLQGEIYDPIIKSMFFARSFACISPLQAGLSVLESMGYGVPYVTTRDAYTGGEIFNIHHGKDGILMNDISELTSIIEDISNNQGKYIEMGRNAKSHYDTCRTPKDMANGLWKAVEYAMAH